MVQDPLAMHILEGKILPGQHVTVDAGAGGKMVFEQASAAEPVASE
jgi:hypothetical protein